MTTATAYSMTPQGSSSSSIRYPSWQREYQACLFETDPTKLLERVQAAEAAIFNRVQELAQNSDSQDTKAERQAIEDSLASIRVLQREKLGFPDWKTE